jgi:hypothetical protein
MTDNAMQICRQTPTTAEKKASAEIELEAAAATTLEDMAVPNVAKTELETATAPKTSATEPEATITESEATIAEPEATITESEATIAEPEPDYDQEMAKLIADSKTHLPTGSCLDAECTLCAIRDCRFLEPLHYHHDGCPSCYFHGIDVVRFQIVSKDS